MRGIENPADKRGFKWALRSPVCVHNGVRRRALL